MILSIINVAFFLVFVAPTLLRYTLSAHKCYTLIDRMYGRAWDKLMFFWGIALCLYRQWLNNNVKKLGKNKYELSFMIGGEMCKLVVNRVIPEVVDVQDMDTDHSYMEELAPYTRFRVDEWEAPTPSVIYYDDGTSWRQEPRENDRDDTDSSTTD